MKSWIQHGTIHQPIESFTALNEEGKEQHYLIAEMKVKGVEALYLGLFKDTKYIAKDRKNTIKLFICNFRVSDEYLPKAKAIEKLKAKVS